MRECGECNVCCVEFTIREISKTKNTPCINLHECGYGCQVYVRRPLPCRLFLCSWIKGYGEEEERPDKIGVVIDNTGISGHKPSAWPLSPEGYVPEDLEFIRRTSKELKSPILVFEHDQLRVNSVIEEQKANLSSFGGRGVCISAPKTLGEEDA